MERDTLSVTQPSPANPRWLHFDPSIRIVFDTSGQADSGRIFQVTFTISDGINIVD